MPYYFIYNEESRHASVPDLANYLDPFASNSFLPVAESNPCFWLINTELFSGKIKK
jgi:hypothetical protein